MSFYLSILTKINCFCVLILCIFYCLFLCCSVLYYAILYFLSCDLYITLILILLLYTPWPEKGTNFCLHNFYKLKHIVLILGKQHREGIAKLLFLSTHGYETTCVTVAGVKLSVLSPVSIQTQSLALRKRKPQETQALALTSSQSCVTQQTQSPANRNARSQQWQPWLAACQRKLLFLNGNVAAYRSLLPVKLETSTQRLTVDLGVSTKRHQSLLNYLVQRHRNSTEEQQRWWHQPNVIIIIIIIIIIYLLIKQRQDKMQST